MKNLNDKPVIVMEYHYMDGDIGAYYVEPNDDLNFLIEAAFRDSELGETTSRTENRQVMLRNIIFRLESPSEYIARIM